MCLGEKSFLLSIVLRRLFCLPKKLRCIPSPQALGSAVLEVPVLDGGPPLFSEVDVLVVQQDARAPFFLASLLRRCDYCGGALLLTMVQLQLSISSVDIFETIHAPGLDAGVGKQQRVEVYVGQMRLFYSGTGSFVAHAQTIFF